MHKSKKVTMKCHFESASRNHDRPNSRRKAIKIKSKGVRSTNVCFKKNRRSLARINANSVILEGKVIIDLPIRTVSEANSFEPWRAKYARHREQKRLVALSLDPLKAHFRLPCRIFLTRFAPDELDAFDNLPMSFKYIVDTVCAIITGNYVAGRADGDKRISIACGQEKSDAYGIRIEVAWD